ncbi:MULTISPECIES: histidinol-phosphatase [Streptomyces]|uniref:Histidinol-phosphatase n=1 Tax=Streptomyces tsukubensis (strain DSM 42081 / NBRC 108919 / NRRL 18488 / 9993) TaxID=1114943 RepID=I2N9W0_STRT9|nr:MULTISPECIES: histidinol-phosphatase [Streptomyces]AZK97625.1 histidinol-phosphatase [Streptomyces tsukubensis]EIF93807.1 inositol-phosphate phosphatase [Streptomyces tsukubensis NRRL18488]MYS66158.1 histidinol-phosphatase [Streptomyces sp. SID5473]QKM66434.1 histidinol-phosphatase [Streptomyces tsukubensis NRRL18488]TAI45227.1 histidinol-phosphatase [Streptomyces tsukubensis]
MPPHADLELALQLADTADSITTRRFQARDLRIREKPDRTPVTDADTAVEAAVREALRSARPDDAFAGEETGGTVTAGRTWMVDPIDGTKNFLRGIPVWATLIALLEDGRPTVGVISAPALHSRWWAAAGSGARLRRGPADSTPLPLRVSGATRLDHAYLSTTSTRTWDVFHSSAAYLRLAAACWEDRAFGDFLQHCMVAEGTLDIAAEPVVNPWDITAVQILVEEAGGVCTDLLGAPPRSGTGALSANPLLHRLALQELSDRQSTDRQSTEKRRNGPPC